jgi:hypothetical protein
MLICPFKFILHNMCYIYIYNNFTINFDLHVKKSHHIYVYHLQINVFNFILLASSFYFYFSVTLLYLIDIYFLKTATPQIAPKRRRFEHSCYVQNDVALFVSH